MNASVLRGHRRLSFLSPDKHPLQFSIGNLGLGIPHTGQVLKSTSFLSIPVFLEKVTAYKFYLASAAVSRMVKDFCFF